MRLQTARRQASTVTAMLYAERVERVIDSAVPELAG